MDDIIPSRRSAYSIWSASLAFILSLCAFVLCSGSAQTNTVLVSTAVAVILTGISAVFTWKRYVDQRTTR